MATGLFNLKQVNQAISQGAWSGYIAPRWVEYLVVAGGGGGGSNAGGGGGAGGLLTGIVTVATGASYTVTVGAGGAGVTVNNVGNAGVSSVFGSISATGGGRGGGYGGIATSGGSGGGGGGGSGEVFVAQGTAGQGNTGSAGQPSTSPYVGGGGGGAGTVATAFAGTAPAVTGGSGGAGIASSISGTVVVYSGGGGGSIGSSGSSAGSGGVGGGGGGATSGGGTATSGGGNTGGGGGGASTGTSGSGGSGIVVVRYPGSVQFFTGGTLSYANGYIIHTFYANGTLAPTTPTLYVTDYQISRSLRFNSADTTYLNRTPASATNRKTWTWSAWVKRNALAANQYLFNASPDSFNNTFSIVSFGSGANEDKLRFIEFQGGSQVCSVRTTQVFRDSSAWYHIVLAIDTTQVTDTNRVRMYVNGAQITSFDVTSYPAQNTDLTMNNNVLTTLGYITTTNNFSGYMTEVNFIDGQALTPSSFGYTDPDTGVWSPFAFVGTYGTNGFYLNFSDNSNTTAATLGKDYSGNGNNFTPNNFSVTAGAGNDSLVDVPTPYGIDTGVGGSVRGNYCTLNPLIKPVGTVTYSDGNLVGTNSGSNWNAMGGTIGISTGKWYWEYTSPNQNSFFGIMVPSINFSSGNPQDANAAAGSVLLCDDNKYQIDFNARVTYASSSHGTGVIVGVAVDMDAGTIVFYINGTSQGSITWTSSAAYGKTVIPMAIAYDTATTTTANFGQRPFAYTAPSGFKALCTQNLPTPTIGATTATQAGKYFNPVLYTGNGGTQSITGVGFQPDLVWTKTRNGAYSNALNDAVRGAGNTLLSDSTSAELAFPTFFTAFTSDGFNAANGGNVFNRADTTYVAWNWKANGSGSTNTAGSITSTVSANTTSGFSIVTWNGTGANATVGHGLGVAPSMILIKSRSSVTNWNSYHISVGAGATIILNTTSGAVSGSTFFNSTAPTSTVFSLGSDGSTNPSGAQQVAYCFAPIAGYSAMGSYIGNGSADGPFIYTGFRPAFVLIKRCDTTSGGYWRIYDSTRNTSNVVDKELYPNDSSAEGTFTSLDFTSNGIKIRNSDSQFNGSSATYLYMAFASTPLKFSLAR